MIAVSNLSKWFGSQTLFEGVGFQLNPGSRYGLVGANGSGKTTLLRNLVGLMQPRSGRILIGGRDFTAMSGTERMEMRRKMGMCFQGSALLGSLSIADNVALPLVIAGYRHQEIGRRVRAALDKVGLLSKELLYRITLSGGEQQRVGIARAVVNKPMLLLADEPTGNLDPELSREIMGLFELFNRVGVSVLIASHDVSLIGQLDHRVITLEHGHIVATAASAAIAHSATERNSGRRRELRIMIFEGSNVRSGLGAGRFGTVGITLRAPRPRRERAFGNPGARRRAGPWPSARAVEPA